HTRGVRRWSRCDGVPGWLQEPDAGHDHRPRSAREGELMSSSLSRRRFITTAVGASVAASAAGVAGFFAQRDGLIPPAHSGLVGCGETLPYATHRVFLSRQPLAREFNRSEISKNFPAINTTLPEDDDYRRDMTRGFQEWRLSVDGLV